MSAPYPGASPFRDRHGRIRWRYRRGGKTISLPEQPGHPAFEEAYAAAVEGRPRRPAATIQRHPRAAEPRSLAAAWQKVLVSPEWKAMRASSREKRRAIAERFLASPVASGGPAWGTMPVADLKRRHVKALLAGMAETPHAGTNLLTVIRKMVYAALDEEWIETDPTHKVRWSPAIKGWRSWTEDELAQFESAYPVGTVPRTVYALALWLGNRRGDVAALRWSDLQDGTFRFTQGKTGRRMVLPVSDELWAALLSIPEPLGATILTGPKGKPRSAKALTGDMRKWCDRIGLSKECVLHGLRKTLGRRAAESDATGKQLQEIMGHASLKETSVYTRDADQARLARDGMAKVVQFRRG